LLTNNPKKVSGLRDTDGGGRDGADNHQPNQYNKRYLETKKEKMGHKLNNIDIEII
jgi:GTP cyclohydrolase II